VKEMVHLFQLDNPELPERVVEDLVTEVVCIVPEEVVAVRPNHELILQVVLGNHQEALDSQVVGSESRLARISCPVRVTLMKQSL